jgi:hypothetical protein
VLDETCLAFLLVLQASCLLSTSPNPKQPPTPTPNLDRLFRCKQALLLLSLSLLLQLLLFVLFLFLLLLLLLLLPALLRLLRGSKLLCMRRKRFSRPLLLLQRAPTLLRASCGTLQAMSSACSEVKTAAPPALLLLLPLQPPLPLLGTAFVSCTNGLLLPWPVTHESDTSAITAPDAAAVAAALAAVALTPPPPPPPLSAAAGEASTCSAAAAALPVLLPLPHCTEAPPSSSPPPAAATPVTPHPSL